jgi:hypothetical protein
VNEAGGGVDGCGVLMRGSPWIDIIVSTGRRGPAGSE